jgi:hypothetical protein
VQHGTLGKAAAIHIEVVAERPMLHLAGGGIDVVGNDRDDLAGGMRQTRPRA